MQQQQSSQQQRRSLGKPLSGLDSSASSQSGWSSASSSMFAPRDAMGLPQQQMAAPAAAAAPAAKSRYYSMLSMPTTTTVGAVNAILHIALLVVLTAVVSVYYSRGSSLPLQGGLRWRQGWTFTPVPCDWMQGAGTGVCMPADSALVPPAWNCTGPYDCMLTGTAPMYEREAQGLFSVTSVPFMVLAFEVICASFSLLYVHYNLDPSDADPISLENGQKVVKGLKRLVMLILLAFTVTFLFMQHTWNIPMNVLLLVEVALLLALAYVAMHKSTDYHESERARCTPAHFVEATLSMPILTVAVLSAAGVDSTTDLVQAFFILAFAYALLVPMELERHKLSADDTQQQPPDAESVDGARILLATSWLLMAPFLSFYGLALQQAVAAPGVAGVQVYALAAACLQLGFIAVVHLIVSAYMMRTAIVRTLMAGKADPAPGCCGCESSYSLYLSFLDGVIFLGKTAVTLTLMIGALSATEPPFAVPFNVFPAAASM